MIMSGLRSGGRGRAWFFSALLLLAGFQLSGRTVPDAGNPPGFFSAVADKMLRSTFPFGVTNIPVYSNGVCVYTPAVQRLLQLSANIYDASNTNFFPTVFRPLFGTDGSTDVFIIGYLQVTNVSGASDPQLAPPHRVADLPLFNTPYTPIYDSSGFVNVYGVPWIIGAKKGLPNFNQFYMVNSVQVTRKLEVTRSSADPSTAIYATNEMYVIGISNNLGISFWNSYSNAYPRPLTLFASDVVSETLTNGFYTWVYTTNFTTGGLAPGEPININPWSGSHWSGAMPNTTPNAASFINANWAFAFQSPMAYDWFSHAFQINPVWQTTTPQLQELPQFGLLITNYLQAYILDGNNVIDYVQLNAPIAVGGLNQALADPDYVLPGSIFYQWSTNTYLGNPPTPYGVVNQMWVSGHPANAPAAGGTWSTAPTPMGITTPSAEAAYFNGFFVPVFVYSGQTYVNNLFSIQAPYTPSRTVYSSFLLQANDPLVHYLASDLDAQSAVAVWQNGDYANADWYHSDDPVNQQLPQPPTTPIKGRYQPWGAANRQMSVMGQGVDANGYNLAYRDPLAWGSDYWNFPTNLMQTLSGLGQVHRGTPWQTVYLKSIDVLQDFSSVGNQVLKVGTNTWMQWTGDLDANDAALMAPVRDWRLAGVLMSLLNTNDPTQLFSVNDSNITDWQNLLGGLLAYSNSAPFVIATTPTQFDTYILSSNSPQALIIANGIVQSRTNQSGSFFNSIGDVLGASALATQSPFLNFGSAAFGQQQTNYGITDSAYEAIPAQLLPLLRPDSIGVPAPPNGSWTVQFSGADGYAYAVQTSTNLFDWRSIGTNQPVQGGFSVPANSVTGSASQYFRTVLLPY